MLKFNGEKMRKAREAKNLPAYKLAVALDVHPNTVLNWESGKSRPDADQVLRVASELGVDSASLYVEQA